MNFIATFKNKNVVNARRSREKNVPECVLMFVKTVPNSDIFRVLKCSAVLMKKPLLSAPEDHQLQLNVIKTERSAAKIVPRSEQTVKRAVAQMKIFVRTDGY